MAEHGPSRPHASLVADIPPINNVASRWESHGQQARVRTESSYIDSRSDDTSDESGSDDEDSTVARRDKLIKNMVDKLDMPSNITTDLEQFSKVLNIFGLHNYLLMIIILFSQR